jgi:AMMECR1 domain-containing protein
MTSYSEEMTSYSEEMTSYSEEMTAFVTNQEIRNEELKGCSGLKEFDE